MSINSTAGDFLEIYGEFSAPEFWQNYGVIPVGFNIPSFEETVQRQIDLFRDPDSFGPNLDIDPSTPQGQYIYNEAKDKYALLLMAQAVYNSFSLFNSSGLALDRNMQYIGIKRKDDSKSQAPVTFDTIDGVTPVTLATGYRFSNQQGDEFEITNTITFVSSADPNATVTAQAVEPGPVDVSAGNLSVITNPRGNLASVTNVSDGITGSDVETDIEARQRSIDSTEARAKSTISATIGQLRNLDGVLQVRAFENKSASTVGVLLPHSIRYLVRGGSETEIGQVLYVNEVPGISYVGDDINTITVTIIESDGVETQVFFDRPEEVLIYIRISITTRVYDEDIKTSVLSYAENTSYGFTIGEEVLGNKLYQPCYVVLQNNGVENTNKVTDIEISTDGVSWADSAVIDSDKIGVFSAERISFITAGS